MKRRGIRTGDLNPRELSRETSRQFLRDARFAAVQKMAEIGELPILKYFEHEVRPGQPLHQWQSLQPANPYSWGAIGQRQKGIVEGTFDCGVSLGLHNAVDGGEANVSFLAHQQR